MKKLKLSFIQDNQVASVVSLAAVNDTAIPQKCVRYVLKHSLSRGGLLKGDCFPGAGIEGEKKKYTYDEIKPGDVFISGDHLVLCYKECAAPGFKEMTLLGSVEKEAFQDFQSACAQVWYREYHLRVPTYMDLEAEE